MRFFAAVSLLFAIVGSQTIDPNSVSISLRDTWCSNQQASCPLLCLQQASTASTTSNSCDPKTLDWSCVCSNGIAPNISEYSQTIPYYECTEVANQCVNNCGLANNACANTCRTAHPCGAQNPTRVNVTSSTASASGGSAAATSGGSDGTFGGAGSGGAATTSSSGSSGGSSGTKSGASVVAINLGRTYGLSVLIAGIFAGFALLA